MSDGENSMVTDFELDRLLAQASKPEPLAGFEARLEQRMVASIAAPVSDNVIAFRPRKAAAAPSRALRLPFAAAMAASLVIGLWLGSNGQLVSLLEQGTETAMLDVSSDFAPAGMEDLGNADADTLS
jgi:hypothetical protein